MSLTVSGTISASGTSLPGGGTVSGSVTVLYSYSYVLPSLSGTHGEQTTPSGLLFVETPELVVTPSEVNLADAIELGDGLLIHHPLDETSELLLDYSGNGYDAISYNTLSTFTRKGGGRTLGEYPYGHIHTPNVPAQSGTYMCSFWFKPTLLLTSGTNTAFTIMESPSFCGESFGDAWNYKTFSPYKGWYLLNSAQTASVTSNKLQLQGNSATNWFNITWSASTLYFPITKSWDWDIEFEFYTATPLSNGQSAGIVFFSSASYYDYCSLILVGKSGGGYAGDIKTQTRSYSYTIATDITLSTGSHYMKFGMKKVGDTVYFRYLDPSTNSWIWSIYYMDVSTWGSDMRVGLMSYNPNGTSPIVYYDKVEFIRGVKPAGVGDTEIPGRVWVSYNETNVSGTIGVRDDGRIWLHTNRDGFAYGTSTYYWEPDQWYLMQFGLLPNANPGDYIWRVNGHQERGLVVGSGIGASSFITSSGLDYFDSYPQPASDSFILDDVTHWNRWLTDEESLRMIYRLSQTSRYITEGYKSSSSSLEMAPTVASGDVSMDTINILKAFYYLGLYQSPSLPEQALTFSKISYRIQKNHIQVTRAAPAFTVNIIRCSSGWMADNLNCLGCVESSCTKPCQCLIKQTISICAWDPPDTYLTFIELSPRKQIDIQPLIITSSGVTSDYAIPQYDLFGPSYTNLQPGENERLVDPEFGTYHPSLGKMTIKDCGSSLKWADTRIWTSHPRQGIYQYMREDNFCFEPFDFNVQPTVTGTDYITTSGRGFTFANPQNTQLAYINRNSAINVDLDYSNIVGSGYHQIIQMPTYSGAQGLIQQASYHYNPVGKPQGTGALEVTTTSGVWITYSGGSPLVSTPSGKFTAPFSYITIPSGLNSWTVETKVKADRLGDVRGQYTGLMLTYKDDPSKYYQLVATYSGIVNLCERSPWSPSCITRSGNVEDEVWFRISKDGSAFNFYYSEDYSIWNQIYPFIVSSGSLTPPMTSNNTPSPYSCWADGQYSATFSAWKAFRGSCNGVDYWASSNTVPPHWIVFDFAQPTAVYYYALQYAVSSYPAGYTSARDFQLQGSNDNLLWTTIDSRINQVHYGICGWGPDYKVTAPGIYRYYRLKITADTGFGNCYRVQTAQIKLRGTNNLSFKLDSDYLIGPVVISDRDQINDTLSTNSLVPQMTSNTTPSGYTISGSVSSYNSVAWRLFDRNYSAPTGWIDYNYAPNPWTSPWIQVDFGESPAIVRGVRQDSHYSWFFLDWMRMYSFQVQGSNNGSNWNTVFTISGIPSDGWPVDYDALTMRWPAYDRNVFWEFSNDTAYRFWRVSNIQPVAGHNTTEPVAIQFKGSPAPQRAESLPALTKASFDYFKVTMASGIENIEIGDDWELMLEAKTPLNSSTNSFVTDFDEMDSSTHYFTYVPHTPLEDEKPVYLRVFARDQPSFHIDYDRNNSFLFVTASGQNNLPITSLINNVSGTSSYMWDESPSGTLLYASEQVYDGYSPHSWILSSDEYSYQGPLSIKKTVGQSSYLHTQALDPLLLNSDWTFHAWLKTPVAPSGNLFGVYDSNTLEKLRVGISGTNFYVYDTFACLGYSDPVAFTTSDWYHVAVVKEQTWLSTFYNGRKVANTIISGTLVTTSGCYLDFFRNYTGYIDLLVVEKGAKWSGTFIESNVFDQIYMFKIVGQHDFSVDITPIADTESPVVIPIGPLPTVSGVCPASGIVFEILDDFSGIKWTQTSIIIDDITVWSGGNNMTEWYDDRGTLTYEELGKKDGEWGDIQLSAEGITYTEGINRLLYPPGTMYSGSGAWGRRFTYNVPDDTEIGYFGKRMNITITGTDNVGYGLEFDDIYPNPFAYNYYFDFIPNDNLQFGEVFLDKGESKRVDELVARGEHFWVDLVDVDYPTTDIVEEECNLTWDDGVNSFVCSGTWFTTWTGNEWTGYSGMVVHRLHWDPHNDWNWTGNRAMHLIAESHNNNPVCGVYNQNEYIIYYGWQTSWFHQAMRNQYPAWEFNHKLPLFVSIKTDAFAPSRLNKSYMFWTSPGYTSGLEVTLMPKPIPIKNLKVGVLAQSPALQYSEDVEVEVYCKDMDGNEMTYVWNFRTEDAPI
jgi:hypothetical protein